MVFAGAIIAPQVVLWVLLSDCMVMVAMPCVKVAIVVACEVVVTVVVVVPHIVMFTVITLRVVLQS